MTDYTAWIHAVILNIPGTWDYPGMSLVRVTDYSMDPGILSIPGTWDYPGMSLVRVTDIQHGSWNT